MGVHISGRTVRVIIAICFLVALVDRCMLLHLLLLVAVSMATVTIVVVTTVTMVTVYVVASDIRAIGLVRGDGCSYIPPAVQVVYRVSNHFCIISLWGKVNRENLT